jgi:hypothetical protein
MSLYGFMKNFLTHSPHNIWPYRDSFNLDDTLPLSLQALQAVQGIDGADFQIWDLHLLHPRSRIQSLERRTRLRNEEEAARIDLTSSTIQYCVLCCVVVAATVQ